MKRRLRGVWYAAQRAGRGLRRHALVSILATAVIASALLLAGVARLADRNAERLTSRWAGGVHMVVYLEQATTEQHAQRITDILMELPAVERVQYVPREQALEHVRGALGERDEIIEGIEVGMLPASLEVTLADGVKDVAAAHPVVDRLAATAGVEEVEFLGEWVEQLTSFLGGVRGAGAALFAFVTIACIAIIWAAMRLGMRRETRETEIVELFGGTSRFVRGPMLIEGAVIGLVASLVAAAILWAVFRAVAPPIESSLSTFGTSSLAFLPASDIGIALAAGTCLGAIGAFLAGGRRVDA